MVGRIYCSGGFTSNFRSFLHRLTQFWLLTENRHQSLRLFRKMGNFVLRFARLLVNFSSGKSGQIHEENVREIPKKKESEKPKKWTKIGDQKGKNPHGCRRPWKSTFLGYFRISRWLAPMVFQKSNFFNVKSVDLRQHDGFAAKIMVSSSDTSRSLIGRSRKHTLCLTDREMDMMIVVTGPLVSINVWSCIDIRHQTTCGFIGGHRK